MLGLGGFTFAEWKEVKNLDVAVVLCLTVSLLFCLCCGRKNKKSKQQSDLAQREQSALTPTPPFSDLSTPPAVRIIPIPAADTTTEESESSVDTTLTLPECQKDDKQRKKEHSKSDKEQPAELMSHKERTFEREFADGDKKRDVLMSEYHDRIIRRDARHSPPSTDGGSTTGSSDNTLDFEEALDSQKSDSKTC